jgi:hypothetical protein
MIKYVPIDAVLNFIPEAIKEQVDTRQIISWAYLMYRTFELPTSEELQVASITIRNHRANLPDNVRRITNVHHQNPGVDLPRTIYRDYGDYRLIIAQEILFSSPYYTTAKPLKYVGQMKFPIIDNSLYCRNCEVGFSIDKTLTCLAIDYPDGDAILTYFSPVEQDGKLMIPDDPDLLMGLSYFVQAKYWEEKQFTHESNSIGLAQDAHLRARGHLGAFEGRTKLKSIDVAKHNVFVMRRNRNINWHRN